MTQGTDWPDWQPPERTGPPPEHAGPPPGPAGPPPEHAGPPPGPAGPPPRRRLHPLTMAAVAIAAVVAGVVAAVLIVHGPSSSPPAATGSGGSAPSGAPAQGGGALGGGPVIGGGGGGGGGGGQLFIGGKVIAVSATSITLSGQGHAFTAAITSSTKFTGVSGPSGIKVGALVTTQITGYDSAHPVATAIQDPPVGFP